ncbi:MAG: nucleotidyltransferase domain-containing protein [Candidatus Woesearchaeota archaeon]
MQKEFRDLVFELAKKASDFDSIRAVVVFGSVARGDADKRSDIDVLVLLDKIGSSDEKKMFSISQDLGAKYEKTVQMVFSKKNFEGLDRNFVETILKEGIVIYGNIPTVRAEKLLLEPFIIINFNFGPDKSKRDRLARALEGYISQKRYKGKTYISRSQGLVRVLHAERIGPSSIIVPYEKLKPFEDLFKSQNVKYRKKDIWMPAVFKVNK